MHVSTHKIRVRYADTDRMGYCYYGNYPTFFEIGRVEALRQLGIRYKDLEDGGVILPVADMDIQYKKPVTYDEEITVETSITEWPSGSRLKFSFKIHNEADELTTTGHCTLVFVNRETSRPCQAPDFMLEVLKPYFQSKT